MDGFAGAIGVSDSDGKASPVVHCYEPSAETDARFYAYILRDLARRGFITSLAKGIRERSTAFDSNAFQSLVLPAPRIAEQRAIVDYLNVETARIDALITKKQQLIRLLEERWLTALSQEFTAAESSETRRATAYCEIVLGRQRSPQHAQGDFMKKYLRAANVKPGRLELDDVMEMNFTPAETGRFRLEKGDVLITEGSGSKSAVGASAVWNGELPGDICFQNTLLRMRPRAGVEPRFLGWWAQFAHATGLFSEIASGANIFHLSAERVRSVPMRKLSLEGQKSIVSSLDEIRQRSLRAESALSTQVSLLTERRQALITAAVTGEFTVPGVA